MKSILISIKPKWVAKILNGEKTIEIRKTMPKYDLPIDVYIYCTKDGGKERLYPVALLDKSNQVFKRAYREDRIDNRTNYLNGKVVAKFTLNKVEEINRYCAGKGISYKTETLNDIELCNKSCLDLIEIDNYLYFKKGYAIHISDLEIFDKPKELSEFYTKTIQDCSKCKYHQEDYCHFKCEKHLTKAPQSWCYVEVLL